MRIRSIAILLLLAVAVLAACKKNTADDDPTLPKVDKLCKKWQIQDVLNNGDSRLSLYQGLIMQFNRNNTYNSDQNGVEANGTWNFNSDSTRLIYDQGTQNETGFDILELKSTSLKLESKSGSNSVEFIYVPF